MCDDTLVKVVAEIVAGVFAIFFLWCITKLGGK
jgi:hypothetical protein